VVGRYRYAFSGGKSKKLVRTDTWPELDKNKNELLEFIRRQFPYSEAELTGKPIAQFLDIAERARKKVEVENAAHEKRQKKNG
jgi:predicted transposase YbfD/YdcC